MSCDSFRRILRTGAPLEGDALAHMRACAACLEAAVAADPENLFRSLGGQEMTPPGGVEHFVQSVMDGVQVRRTESRLSNVRAFPAWSRWAAAAVLGTGLIGAALVYQPQPPVVPTAAIQKPAPVAQVAVAVSRPVVENYENSNATIVQLASNDDMQVVMVFDESLPADL